MVQVNNYEVSCLNETEVQLAVDWAAAEGWNPGLHDGTIFHHTDPGGFLAGYWEDQPVATISAVCYGQNYGFIGFYIVRSEFRGRGFGLKLWKAAMDRLAGRNIGLDGVVAQQENYKKSGFALAYRNVRFSGSGFAAAAPSAGVVPLAEVPLAQVAEYDSELFFSARPAFLREWIGQPMAVALGYQTNGRLQGFGVIRKCQSGYKIGPLFADEASIGETLFRSLAAQANGETVYLDVPAPNEAAISLVHKYRLSPVFETARMYTGAIPPIELARVFGVTSFELG